MNDSLFEGMLGKKVAKKEYDPLKKYYEMMEKGEILENLEFSSSESMSGLRLVEEGVEIFLPKENINEYFRNRPITREYLYRTYNVKIMDIDRDNRKVTVSFVAVQEALRPEYIGKIEAVLKKKRNFFTKGRVIAFMNDDTLCLVDIMGLGIRGLLYRDDWSYGYVSDIRAFAKVGDVIDCAITGHSKKSRPGSPCYQLSKKVTENGDPWADAKRSLPVGSSVVVKCSSKTVRDFVGSVKGVDGVPIYCLYPDMPSTRTGKMIKITAGRSYKGFIREHDENFHCIRVKILDEYNEEEV